MQPPAGPPAAIHATCVCRDGAAVLLLGPPGAGKSDLALRLLARGFSLVADDRVVIEAGLAARPPALAGLLEVRGLGIVRLAHVAPVRVALAVTLSDAPPPRLPLPRRLVDPPPADPPLTDLALADLAVPLVTIDPRAASAPDRVALALECALGRVTQVAGAFAP